MSRETSQKFPYFKHGFKRKSKNKKDLIRLALCAQTFFINSELKRTDEN